MRILILLILFCFFLTSCSFPTYIVDNKTQRIGLDFSKGNWLLNEVDAPIEIKDELTEMALNDFKNLNNSVIYIYNAKGLLLPKKISLNPNQTILENLKKGTGYDFFINIKAANTRADFGTIDLTPHRFNDGGKNQNELIIEVYDLNAQEIIYSKKVTATVERQKDNQDVHLSKSSKSLILGAYKKLIKEIREKSIVQKQK